ncbi:dTDP-4-dehydrorhamnose reductase [filamentous cyanobacterium CCP1]|nr:dTDP-4-dehydrorhamnose reductase [filamentous cyanobacterium CCP2]PSB68526.1 dTDP-4-dehydrorhamnose reductase [filamentous cyanobacterium CCP1]
MVTNKEPIAPPPLELWGGIECTVNRVGDEYFDQLEWNGHAARLEDLDRFAMLGIQALRYPILWERIAPNGLEQADWTWADQRLERLRELEIRPIVGLIHHGSGPGYTSLVDPAFPEKLAEFADAVAHRYPWITHYTPVNEPLTTARFSGLYGHWYPHGREDFIFIRALLAQCRAIICSMQAIRQVNATAQLVQTEDLGKTFSTPLLAYQAEFENHRRWLSFDLLCGRVDARHPLWNYLQQAGIESAELEWFLEHPCPPDIVGVNHYITSDRFLDERLEWYPVDTHGGNGKHNYADVAAVRVCVEGKTSPEDLLHETWNRYQLPIAVTEVHLGCTREEQLRWLQEVWDAAQSVRQDGIAVRAVTVWSLLGAYDWNSLVTRSNGFYEPGVFDLRSPTPRSTALAEMIRYLSQNQPYPHPLLAVPGWWQRDDRFLHPPVSYAQQDAKLESQTHIKQRSRTIHHRLLSSVSSLPTISPSRPLLITGATGTLGQAFARICAVRGIPYVLASRKAMDITNSVSVHNMLSELNPWAVINAAGYVRVDDAEREPYVCWSTNAEGAAVLAKACLHREIALVTFSSDLVFDGSHNTPYLESSPVSPLNVYGHSKARSEEWVLAVHPYSLVIRTSAFFGPWDQHNFLTIALLTLSAGETFRTTEDTTVSPTYVPDLVNVTLDLLIDGECGIWHLANVGATTWAELARFTAKQAGLNAAHVQAHPNESLGWIAPRPVYSVLGSERATLLPTLDHAIHRYLHEKEVQGTNPMKKIAKREI